MKVREREGERGDARSCDTGNRTWQGSLSMSYCEIGRQERQRKKWESRTDKLQPSCLTNPKEHLGHFLNRAAVRASMSFIYTSVLIRGEESEGGLTFDFVNRINLLVVLCFGTGRR